MITLKKSSGRRSDEGLIKERKREKEKERCTDTSMGRLNGSVWAGSPAVALHTRTRAHTHTHTHTVCPLIFTRNTRQPVNVRSGTENVFKENGIFILIQKQFLHERIG